MCSNEDLLLLGLTVSLLPKKKRNKRKRFKWSKQWLLDRDARSHMELINVPLIEPDDYRNYLRMDEHVYTELLELITPLILKIDTVMRTAITPHERLSTTLRFLATGRNCEDLKFSACISAQALGKIIPETCQAIFHILQHHYCKFPVSREEWERIGFDFQQRCQFPNYLGAVDGKHIRIIPPAGSGSYYYNYKHFHSIVLMGIANSNYELIMFDVGTNRRISDGGVVNNSSFYKALVPGKLNLPPPNSHNNLPYVLVGDDAFSLRHDFLKPYSQSDLNDERTNFNKRLCRARRIIENVFEIMANRFRIFHTEIGISVENIETVVMATCALHNYLRNKNPNYFTELTEDDSAPANSEIMTRLQKGHGSKRGPDNAKEVRELFVEYFKNN